MFAVMAKEGSTVSGLLDTLATVTSLCLQYGVPIEKLEKKFRNMKYEPRGIVAVGRDDQRTTNSISEYIFQAAASFAKEKKESIKNGGKIEVKNGLGDTANNDEDDPKARGEKGSFCPTCGDQLYKKNHCVEMCYTCNYEDQKGCGQ
jgi:hypothetical protein